MVEQRDFFDLSAYGDGQFDAVFCVFGVIGAMEDRHHAWMGEVVRVLKPGGKFVMSTWANFTRSQYHTTVFGAMRICMSQGAAAPLWTSNAATAAATTGPATAGAAANGTADASKAAPLSFDNEGDLTALPSPHFSAVSSQAVTLPYARTFHDGRIFCGKGAQPMFIPAADPDVERKADDAAIAYADALISRDSTAQVLATSLSTIGTKA